MSITLAPVAECAPSATAVQSVTFEDVIVKAALVVLANINIINRTTVLTKIFVFIMSPLCCRFVVFDLNGHPSNICSWQVQLNYLARCNRCVGQ